jgi:hypothetical protein
VRRRLTEVFNPVSEVNVIDTVPVHVPTNELIVGLLGVGFLAGSSFSGRGLDLVADAAGVGVASSLIGAGKRGTLASNTIATATILISSFTVLSACQML